MASYFGFRGEAGRRNGQCSEIVGSNRPPPSLIRVFFSLHLPDMLLLASQHRNQFFRPFCVQCTLLYTHDIYLLVTLPSYTPTVLQQQCRLFQAQPCRLGIYQPDQHLAHDADASIQRKCPWWCQEIHERQKCQPNDKVGRPVGRRGDAAAQRANRHGKQLALHPRHVAQTDGVRSHIQYDAE